MSVKLPWRSFSSDDTGITRQALHKTWIFGTDVYLSLPCLIVLQLIKIVCDISACEKDK